MRLAGKIAIVTGGASGFGAAIARRFAKEGAKVLVADLNGGGADTLAKDIRAAGGGAEAMRCNVAIEEDFRAAVQRAIDLFGGLDIVVNNAGTTHRNAGALQVAEADLDRVLSVNVKSIFWCVRFAIPYFQQRRAGVILNVASATASKPAPGLTWYSASKAAVVNLTKGLASEFARDGIRVNSICPMLGETAMLQDFMGIPDTPENRQAFLARVPLGRLTRPDDVANAALYFASDEADYVTGVALDVDGGRSL